MCWYTVWTKSVELNAVSLNDPWEMFAYASVKFFLFFEVNIQDTAATSALEVAVWLRIAVESVRTVARCNLLNLSQI